MSSSTFTQSASAGEALSASYFVGVAQEVGALLIFFLSAILWRHLMRPAANSKTKQKLDIVESSATRPASSGPRKSIDSRPAAPQAQPVFLGKKNDALQQSAPAVRATEQQMIRLLENREFTRALNLYRSLERDGKDALLTREELFSAFVQSAIRVGKVDVVERLLKTMKRNGIPPSLEFWRTTLRMLSSRKHFTTCLSIYNFFGKKIPSDKVVFSCLINAALDCGSPDVAFKMLDRYVEAGLEPKDHVLLFRTYVALGDADSAAAVFKQLGARMTPLMVNLTLLACVNAKQPDRALGLVQKAHELEKSVEGSGDGEATERLVDVVSYNTVIKGFAQAGAVTRCFECLRMMRPHGVEPDDVTFGTLLDVCIAGEDTGKAVEVVDLLTSQGEGEVDTVTCTLFIKGLVRAGCLSRAVELYDEMRGRGGEAAKPDVVTYSVLIKAFVDARDLERALRFVEDMRKDGHQPDDIIITHLLEGCRHASNHELGKRLFSEMLESSVQPSEFTLIAMVKLHGRCGAHEEAHELVSTWGKRFGVWPSVIHYTCLMSGCLRSRNYDQAWAAYELMLASGIEPDDMAVATMLPGVVAAQQWDRALQLAGRALQSARGKVVDMPAEPFNSALSQMLSGDAMAVRYATQLQALMKEAGIPITARNSKRME